LDCLSWCVLISCHPADNIPREVFNVVEFAFQVVVFSRKKESKKKCTFTVIYYIAAKFVMFWSASWKVDCHKKVFGESFGCVYV